MPDTPSLISAAQSFYPKLAANNSKDWWQENRGTYDTVLKPGAQDLLTALSDPLSDLADAPVTTKLFRPHRDVRFSKDKTPYNTHLHMMWQITGDAPQLPVFFFGVGLDYVTAGAGMMGFDKPMLESWRSFADLDHARMLGIFDDLTSQGVTFREPDLKRIPPAYAKDHPAGDLLRMKAVVGHLEIADTTDLTTALITAFKTLWPLNALLMQIAES